MNNFLKLLKILFYILFLMFASRSFAANTNSDEANSQSLKRKAEEQPNDEPQAKKARKAFVIKKPIQLSSFLDFELPKNESATYIIFFDIDRTLLRMPQYFLDLSVHEKNDLLFDDEAIAIFMEKKLSCGQFMGLLPVLEAQAMATNVWVESCIPDFLTKLKNSGALIMGLTARQRGMSVLTRDNLRNLLGYNFEELCGLDESVDDAKVDSQGNICQVGLERNIFFTANIEPKINKMEEIIADVHRHKPITNNVYAYFFDDRYKEIAACQESKIKDCGLPFEITVQPIYYVAYRECCEDLDLDEYYKELAELADIALESLAKNDATPPRSSEAQQEELDDLGEAAH